MFNNNFNGYKSNVFNPARKNLETGNIAGLKKKPSNIAGLNKRPNDVAGTKKMPMKNNLFSNVYRDNSGQAKQIMNSDGQNILHGNVRIPKN